MPMCTAECQQQHTDTLTACNHAASLVLPAVGHLLTGTMLMGADVGLPCTSTIHARGLEVSARLRPLATGQMRSRSTGVSAVRTSVVLLTQK
jgi:hypothetical protein